MKKRGRVLVAMSGGIDSTVAAMLLHQSGHEVIGITMKTWSYTFSGGGKKETGCCNLDSINDARQVAVDMGFPHYILDMQPEFKDVVINNFVSEYLAGRTPNPCILCNTDIKWNALLKKADDLGCPHIATGHYAHISKENERYFVSKAIDASKDQSYVLWGLTQENLSRTLFPLANIKKIEARKIAAAHGYEALSKKGESYEICFVPDDDYRGFLNRKVSHLEERVKNGNFILKDGTAIGQHKGYPYYTVGQRKGLGIATGTPMYVSKIIPETNEVVLSENEPRFQTAMLVKQLNWQKEKGLEDGLSATVKIRYRDKGATAKLFNDSDGVRVVFNNPVKGIAPGQSAVFYAKDAVVGGGIIYLAYN